MLTILGCGNPNRSDDGVGGVIADRIFAHLQNEPIDGVNVFATGTDGMGVMFKARGSTSLIIIDACSTGETPGAIFEVPGKELEGEPPDSYNLHDFRWDHALYAGRKIFREEFPDDVTIFLIEAQSLDLGLELSPAVARAAGKVTTTIIERIKSREHDG